MNKKILIVDDEKEIVDLLEVYLSNDGYSVYKCYNGLEAMKPLPDFIPQGTLT